jgi:ABC-type dipeptide/oligopeptide/nickel transport system permease component
MCLLHRILSSQSLAIIVVAEFTFGLIKSTEQHPSLEYERPAVSQEIPYILSKLKTHYNLKPVTHQQMHYLLNLERFNFTLKFT